MADDWGAALVTTFALMAVSSIIAAAIGIPSAIAATILAGVGVTRQDRETGKWSLVCHSAASLWIAAGLFSIATPLILHAAAWESTAGKFGWLVKTMTGGNLLWVGWIHGVHGAAIVGLLTFWAIRNIPDPVLQHASMDLTPWRIWRHVRLPLTRPWIVVGLILVWLVAATEMSVADLHSVRTVADQFYLFYALDPTITSVMMVVVVPLVLAVVPCTAWYLMGRSGLFIDMAHRRTTSRPGQDAPADTADATGAANAAVRPIIALIWLGLSLLVCQAAMFAGLVLQAGHAVRVEEGRAIASWSVAACVRSLAEAPSLFAQEYGWTAQLACLTTITVIPLACVVARRSRIHPKSTRAIDAAMVAVFFVPGPLVAMAVVRLFALDVPGFEILATQTLVPTMMAAGVRSFVIAYVILRFAYSQISESVWQSARLDASWWRRVAGIELPAIWPALLIASIASAILASGDVPATLPVLPPGVTTVGTRLFGLLHSGARYQEASLAFWYFTALLVFGAIAWVVVKRRMLSA